MNHIMIDIETLSTAKNAALVSIGAVFFNPATGELGEKFYRTVTRRSCEDTWMDVDENTVAWWEKQSEVVRAALNCPNALPVAVALHQFAAWIEIHSEEHKPFVWGNGPSFDCAILATAFDSVGIKLPWRYSNERCVRTIVDLGRSLLGIDPKHSQIAGVAHNALDDAIHQAKYVSQIYQSLSAMAAPGEVAA